MTAPKAINATQIATPTRDHVRRRSVAFVPCSWPAPHGLVGVAHGDVARREDRLDDRPVLADPPQGPASRELGHEERL